jgi:DNA-binding NarL/FixJ family response regulator
MLSNQVSSDVREIQESILGRGLETPVARHKIITEPRVLLCDNHPIFRDALRALLESSRFKVIGEAWDSETVLRKAIEQKPDILLMDWSLARQDGMAVLRKIAASGAAVRTLLFSVVLDKEELLEALRLGVCGVVLKTATTQMFLAGIQSVLSGEYWVGQDSVASLIAALRDPRPPKKTQPSHKDFGLTPREREIVAAVLAGYSNSDIAGDFSLSEHTVKHHITHIFDKLGVSTRLELALFAINHQLVSGTV